MFYLLIVLIIVLVTFLLAYQSNKKFKKTILIQWQNQLEYTTEIATLNVESFISKFTDNLNAVANAPYTIEKFLNKETSAIQTDGFCNICTLYEAYKKDVKSLLLINSKNYIVHAFPDNSEIKGIISKSKAFHQFNINRNLKNFVEIDFHPKSQTSYIYISAPVYHSEKLIGVIQWQISIDNVVNKYINPYIDSKKSGYLWLIDDQLNILAHHDNNYSGLNVQYILTDYEITGKVGHYNVKKSAEFLQQSRKFFDNIGHIDKGSGNYIDFAHNQYSFAVFHTINLNNQKWSIILSIPYKDIFEPVKKNNVKTYALVLLLVIMILTISIIFFSLEQKSIKLEKESEYLLALAKSAEELKNEKQKRMTALIDGQENERRRISREIHDSLGQQLLAMKIKLENICSRETEGYHDLHQFLIKAIDEAKEISVSLAPIELYEVSLDSALYNLTQNITKTTGIKTFFVSYGVKNELNMTVKTYLYRIVQEALSNVLKHAGATQVDIQLLGNDNQVNLIIQDNGKGFEFNKGHRNKGNGINNIIERVNILKGNIEFFSKPNEYTRIEIKVNLNEF